VKGRKRRYVNGTSGWSDVFFKVDSAMKPRKMSNLWKLKRQTDSPLNSSERMLSEQCLILNF